VDVSHGIKITFRLDVSDRSRSKILPANDSTLLLVFTTRSGFIYERNVLVLARAFPAGEALGRSSQGVSSRTRSGTFTRLCVMRPTRIANCQ